MVADKSVKSKNGTTWKIIYNAEQTGRFQNQNVFTAKSGTTPYSRTASTPLDSFRLLVDEGMLRHIKKCTEDFAKVSNPNWKMSDKELEAFIGLLYLRGVMNARNFPIKDMWSNRYGCDAFRKTMTRDRFMEIKKFLRFDMRNTRSERLQDDKFCLMSFVLSRFVSNSQRSYNPEESLTIDEQLFPTKAVVVLLSICLTNPTSLG
jgi:Transposase IS4